MSIVILVVIGCSLESPPPTPIPTIVPTPPMFHGLGVRADRIRILFSEGLPSQPEKPTPIDEWESAPLADGTPRSLGNSQDDSLLMELIGPEHDLTQVTLVSAAHSADPITSYLYNRFLLGLLVPEWEGSLDWLADSVEEADRFMDVPANQGKIFTTFITRYGKVVEFWVIPEPFLVNLSIKAIE